MPRFRFLEHTADIKIKIYGSSKEELFKNALYGMFKAAGYKSEDEKVKRDIRLESSDLESLLVDFLSEALYLSEVNQEVYSSIVFEEFNDKKIEGTLVGKKLKEIGIQIKGVTYHNLKIVKENNNWEATILFDV